MAVSEQRGQMIEMEGVLTLAPAQPVPREMLEEATMEVERVLAEHALLLTDGASASANLDRGCIEVDIVVEGASVAELYQKVALIVTQIGQYCEQINLAPLNPGLPMMELQGSLMRRVAPAPAGPLVPT